MTKILSDAQIRAIFLDYLKDSVESSLTAALAALTLHFESNCLHITFRHKFYGEFFKKIIQSSFEQLARECLGTEITITYEPASVNGSLVQPVIRHRINAANSLSDISFSDFMESPKNAPALAAARKLCAGNEPELDLVIFTGPSGCGKTCLLAAISSAIMASQGARSVVHCRAAAFASPESPEQFWQQPRALILDDLQELEHEVLAQKVLANYIDAARKTQVWTRIVFALCGKNIGIFDARLERRLEQGLILRLEPADLATRLAYIEKMCKKMDIKLSRQQIINIARTVSRISAIYGLLQKLKFYGINDGKILTPEALDKLLLPEDTIPGWQRIITLLAERLGVTTADIMGTSRRQEFVRARQAAMFLCRVRLGLSYPELGRIFGGKDHSTVLYGIKKIQQLRQTDRVLHNILTELEIEPD